VSDYLSLPLRPGDVRQALRRVLERRDRLQAWTRLEVNRNTRTLQDRLSGLEALEKIGRAVTSSLDLDSILTAVVDAAVDLTGPKKAACSCWTSLRASSTCALPATSRTSSCAPSACPSRTPWRARSWQREAGDPG